MIKFQKFAVVDSETKAKARVSYCLDNRVDGRKCVTIYAKDYNGSLRSILRDDYVNLSDSQVDYFEAGKAVLFEGHPDYMRARSFVEALQAA